MSWIPALYLSSRVSEEGVPAHWEPSPLLKGLEPAMNWHKLSSCTPGHPVSRQQGWAEPPWDQLAEVEIFHCLTHKEDAQGTNFPFKWSYFTAYYPFTLNGPDTFLCSSAKTDDYILNIFLSFNYMIDHLHSCNKNKEWGSSIMFMQNTLVPVSLKSWVQSVPPKAWTEQCSG